MKINCTYGTSHVQHDFVTLAYNWLKPETLTLKCLYLFVQNIARAYSGEGEGEGGRGDGEGEGGRGEHLPPLGIGLLHLGICLLLLILYVV